ncbi:hypothetical protein DD238_008376 [Peronospora effusa]|nr:hypothetical protein DD238_008376 [Peronospora effusa]
MSVFKFKTIDQVIERANDSVYGLRAGVVTKSIDNAIKISNGIQTVYVNGYDVFDANTPFGGFKDSGIGRENGELGLCNYLQYKTVIMKTRCHNIESREFMYNRMANSRSTTRESLFSGASSRAQKGKNVDNGEQAKRLLEEQNDEQISHLSLQITQLKQLSGSIHSEVVDQNRFLDGMGTEFDNTEGLLGGTMKRLGVMMEQGGSKHMLYLILFVVLVFLLLYFTIRSH